MFYPEGLVDFALEKSFIPKLPFFLLHRWVQKWLFAKYCPHFSFITLVKPKYLFCNFKLIFLQLFYHQYSIFFINEKGNICKSQDFFAHICFQFNSMNKLAKIHKGKSFYKERVFR